MENFSESEIKYLAGLFDANASLSMKFVGNGLYLELCIAASENTDRKGYIKSLSERIGNYSYRVLDKDSHGNMHCLKVASRKELNILLPRVLKHMVVKGKQWNAIYCKYNDMKGVDVRDIHDELKKFNLESRNLNGPVKPKTHPSWAWVAGYLDGDGSYIHKKYGKRHTIRACVTSHISCRDGIDLMHKAFGGQIKLRESRPNAIEWVVALGKGSTSFAVPFLKKMHKHSRLKKHRIECILSFHNALATTK